MKFIILGCGSSLGVPRSDGFFGKCNPKNKKNYRSRCSAAIITKNETVAASDAFFPFVDGIEKLVQSGISAIIQPAGSIRDKEIIKFANSTNTILVFSKTRHFRH